MSLWLKIWQSRKEVWALFVCQVQYYDKIVLDLDIATNISLLGDTGTKKKDCSFDGTDRIDIHPAFRRGAWCWRKCFYTNLELKPWALGGITSHHTSHRALTALFSPSPKLDCIYKYISFFLKFQLAGLTSYSRVLNPQIFTPNTVLFWARFLCAQQSEVRVPPETTQALPPNELSSITVKHRTQSHHCWRLHFLQLIRNQAKFYSK